MPSHAAVPVLDPAARVGWSSPALADRGPSPTEGTELGRGRSAVVCRLRDEYGREVARKIFVGDAAAKAVNYVLTGAPNPYGWCADAVACAAHRRTVVAELVDYWFGPKLTVARAVRQGWNPEYQAHELDLELVRGRPAALRHPLSPEGQHEARQLRDEILRPLLRHLDEAGLDGQAWQAGRGNPVGLANFLRRDDGSWVWIDLESGVPALAPASPWQLLSYYLPRSWRHRRPLFDDVDVQRLRAYVTAHDVALRAYLGSGRRLRLHESIEALDRSQEAWRGLPRVRRSIDYRLSRQEITAEEAEWYAARAGRWYARELARSVPLLGAGVRRAARWVGRQLATFDYAAAARSLVAFLSSSAYRTRIARLHVSARIRSWEERGQLDARDAAAFRAGVEADDVSPYFADFGVHLGMKPAVKAIQWLVIPALLATGVSGPTTAVLGILLGGACARTLYTLGRSVGCVATGRRPPWVALLVGALPVIGNAAYPLEILRHGAREDGVTARFVICSTLTLTGEKLPIWGGRDTGTEHAVNALAERWIRWSSRAR